MGKTLRTFRKWLEDEHLVGRICCESSRWLQKPAIGGAMGSHQFTQWLLINMHRNVDMLPDTPQQSNEILFDEADCENGNVSTHVCLRCKQILIYEGRQLLLKFFREREAQVRNENAKRQRINEVYGIVNVRATADTFRYRNA